VVPPRAGGFTPATNTTAAIRHRLPGFLGRTFRHISRVLTARGTQVVHISADGAHGTHSDAEIRLLRLTGARHPDLFQGEQGLLRMGDMGGYWNFWLFARGDRGSVAHEWSGRPMPEPYIQTFQAHIMIGGT